MNKPKGTKFYNKNAMFIFRFSENLEFEFLHYIKEIGFLFVFGQIIKRKIKGIKTFRCNIYVYYCKVMNVIFYDISKDYFYPKLILFFFFSNKK